MKTNLLKTSAKKKSNNKTATSKLTPAEQFAKLWKRVQKEKTGIEKALEQQADLVAQFNSEVLADEIIFSNQLYAETQHLIGFLAKKSLSSRNRHTLMMWILSHIEVLDSRPFEMECDIKDLTTALQPYMPELLDDDLNDESLFEQDDLFGDDLFNADEFEEQDPYSFADEEDLFEYEESPWEIQAIEAGKAAEELFNTSAINKMFRQLAKILHPDLELDEEQKAIKNEQMASLLKAREKQDVLTIFELFCIHGGKGLPSFDDQELKRLNELLKNQLLSMQFEKKKALYEIPFHGMVYDKFYRNNQQLTQLALQTYKNEIREAINDSKRLIKKVTTLAELKKVMREKEIELEMAFIDEIMFDSY